MGQGYLLACPDGGESQLLEAVERVDTAMCQIRDAGKIRARDRVAVLAALNLAFDLAGREASPAQPALNTPKATGPTSPDEDEPRLSSLLERLDQCLNQDGQLI